MTKQQLIECPNCHKFTPFVEQHTHLQCQPFRAGLGYEIAEIIEYGTRCQHCEYWSHIGYYTPLLIERQEQLTNRRKQRAFKRDFDKFQIEAEKILIREVGEMGKRGNIAGERPRDEMLKGGK